MCSKYGILTCWVMYSLNNIVFKPCKQTNSACLGCSDMNFQYHLMQLDSPELPILILGVFLLWAPNLEKRQVVSVKPDPVRKGVLILLILVLFSIWQLQPFSCASIACKECNESILNICRLPHYICSVSCHFPHPLKKHKFHSSCFLAQHFCNI